MQDKLEASPGKTPSAAPRSGNGTNAESFASNSRATGSSGGATDQDKLASAATQVKDQVADAAKQAGAKVASRLDVQKDRTAEGLGSVAQALRQTSDQMRNEDKGSGIHEYVASAANQVERFSDYLRSTNTRELVNGVERFARQQPALFVGGAFVLGLIGARFLKSTSQTRAADFRGSRDGYRNDSYAPSRFGSSTDQGGRGAFENSR
jgi:hypothetical protein